MPTTVLRSDEQGGETTDLRCFLAGLQIEMSAVSLNVQDEEAVVNLARHTTHFINHPYRKWENGDLRSWVAGAPCGEGWVVRVRDRFGDYGVSGALTFAVTSRTMQVGLLFLTCPVLGRQVEYAFLSWVAQLAEARGAELIEIPFVRGRDNQDIENLCSDGQCRQQLRR